MQSAAAAADGDGVDCCDAAVDNPLPLLMEMEWSRLLSAAAADTDEYKLVFIKNNYFFKYAWLINEG